MPRITRAKAWFRASQLRTRFDGVMIRLSASRKQNTDHRSTEVLRSFRLPRQSKGCSSQGWCPSRALVFQLLKSNLACEALEACDDQGLIAEISQHSLRQGLSLSLSCIEPMSSFAIEVCLYEVWTLWKDSRKTSRRNSLLGFGINSRTRASHASTNKHDGAWPADMCHCCRIVVGTRREGVTCRSCRSILACSRI